MDVRVQRTQQPTDKVKVRVSLDYDVQIPKTPIQLKPKPSTQTTLRFLAQRGADDWPGPDVAAAISAGVAKIVASDYHFAALQPSCRIGPKHPLLHL